MQWLEVHAWTVPIQPCEVFEIHGKKFTSAIFKRPQLYLVFLLGPKGPGGMSIPNNYCIKCQGANKKVCKSGSPYSTCRCTSESLHSTRPCVPQRTSVYVCMCVRADQIVIRLPRYSVSVQLSVVKRRKTGLPPGQRSCSAPPRRATHPRSTASRKTNWRSPPQTATEYLTATDRANFEDLKVTSFFFFFFE